MKRTKLLFLLVLLVYAIIIVNVIDLLMLFVGEGDQYFEPAWRVFKEFCHFSDKKFKDVKALCCTILKKVFQFCDIDAN